MRHLFQAAREGEYAAGFRNSERLGVKPSLNVAGFVCVNIALISGYLAIRKRKQPIVIAVLLGTGVVGFQAGVKWINQIILRGI